MAGSPLVLPLSFSGRANGRESSGAVPSASSVPRVGRFFALQDRLVPPAELSTGSAGKLSHPVAKVITSPLCSSISTAVHEALESTQVTDHSPEYPLNHGAPTTVPKPDEIPLAGGSEQREPRKRSKKHQKHRGGERARRKRLRRACLNSLDTQNPLKEQEPPPRARLPADTSSHAARKVRFVIPERIMIPLKGRA